MNTLNNNYFKHIYKMTNNEFYIILTIIAIIFFYLYVYKWGELPIREQFVNLFSTIERTTPFHPSDEDIISSFNKCMETGDTVKGCLTTSYAGYNPSVCANLCSRYYGNLSKYCSTVCNTQQQQINNSSRSGPA